MKSSPVIVADESVDLRRGIDYIGVTVCFVAHDGEGNVLLHKRSQNCRDERGRWDNGGGALEFGEGLTDGVRREIQEELTALAKEVRYLGSIEVHRVNDDGLPTHWIAMVHAALVDPTEVAVAEPHKIDDIGWFTRATLPDPLHSQCHRVLAMAADAGIIA